MAITWNPSDKKSDITLSNGNLTASRTPVATGSGIVRATSGVGNGKFAFQFVFSAINDPVYDAVGLANSSASLSDTPGNNVNGWGYFPNGEFYMNAATVVWLQPYSVGDVITIAWYTNGSTRLAWVRVNTGNWNNSGSADPATLTGGINTAVVTGNLFAMFGSDQPASTTTAGTADFDGPFTLPSGFSYYDASGGGTQTLSPSLLTNSSTLYAPTVTRGARTLAPSLFTNTSTFYAPTVSQGGATQTLAPSLYTNSAAFYAPTVSRGPVSLSPSVFTNASTFYAATVSRGAVTLTPARFDNSSSVYSPTVSRGAVTLAPSLFTNTSVFYAPTVTQGGATQTLSPVRFDNASTVYAPTVSRGAVTLSPTLFTNLSAFYPPAIIIPGAAQILAPGLFTNAAIIFSPTVANDNPPGTYPEAIEGRPTTIRRALIGGGSVSPGFIPSTGRVITTALKGRP